LHVTFDNKQSSLQLIAGAQISQLHRVSVDPSDGLIGDAEPLDQV